VNLWVPLEVASLDRARSFYEALGLAEVDSWDRDGERGAVLRVRGDAYVELVQPAPGPAPGPAVAFALELADERAVDAAAGPGQRFPRGHYGTTVHDPDGVPILVWSEK